MSVHFPDLDNYQREWDIDDLPWDAVTSIPPGEEHPDTLDQKLIDAINARVLPPADQVPRSANNASLAFLYLYMTIAYGAER